MVIDRAILNLARMGGKIHIPAAVRSGVVEAVFSGCVSNSLTSGGMISEGEKLNSVSAQGQDWYGKKKQMPPERLHLRIINPRNRWLFPLSVISQNLTVSKRRVRLFYNPLCFVSQYRPYQNA